MLYMRRAIALPFMPVLYSQYLLCVCCSLCTCLVFIICSFVLLLDNNQTPVSPGLA